MCRGVGVPPLQCTTAGQEGARGRNPALLNRAPPGSTCANHWEHVHPPPRTVEASRFSSPSWESGRFKAAQSDRSLGPWGPTSDSGRGPRPSLTPPAAALLLPLHPRATHSFPPAWGARGGTTRHGGKQGSVAAGGSSSRLLEDPGSQGDPASRRQGGFLEDRRTWPNEWDSHPG